MRTRRFGFTLLEVVVAIGVFAVGIVAVIGLLSPVARSISAVSEAEAATRTVDALLARLQALPFAAVVSLVQDPATILRNDASGTYNSANRSNPAVIFASREGEVGLYDTVRETWMDSTGAVMANAEKFFEIDLIRDATLSPPGSDAVAAMMAFTVRVRWPAWLPSATGAGVQVGASGGISFNHGEQQVLLISGSIRR